MTVKRFEKYVPDICNGYTVAISIIDNETGKQSASVDDFVNLLNELHEENRGLQRHLDVMQSGALTDDKRIKELYDENEQLKSDLRYWRTLGKLFLML